MPNKFLHFQSRFLMGCFCLLSVLKLVLPAVAQGSPKQVSAERIQHGFLVCGNMTALFDENSQVVWQVDGGSRDGYVLGNGNLLISNGRVAREYTRSNEVVWSYQLNAVNKELGTAVRLDSGNTMLVERGIKPRLLEINAQGEIKAEIPLQPDTDNAHMQTRMARKLANGNYIAPHLLGFAIKEYAPDGTVLKTIRTDLAELGGREEENWPFTAIRLANGNTLANLTHGNKTVEFDISGKVVWRVDNTDVEGRFSDPCGGQRLPNGNTVIASYAQRDASKPRLFEITPDKKVVWEFFHPSAHAHGIHVISTNGKKLSDAGLK
ncbi:MAG: hypothetical protein O2964_02815 [Verrucomicrobia bacterium]|jgi:hypothetical protein|nr:hypothetical protein [Verrucomicrobiota bacterium]